MPYRSLPLHLSAACFLGAFATDFTYSRTAEMMWANFSAWLLAAGLLLGGVAVVGCIIDLVTRRLEITGLVWFYLVLLVAVFILALLNAFIHSRDAWTSVVPTGLTLSAATVVVILVSGVFGMMVNRQYLRKLAR